MKVVPLSLLLSLLVHSIEGQGPISRVRCRRPSGSQGAVIVQGCKKRTCTRVTSRRGAWVEAPSTCVSNNEFGDFRFTFTVCMFP